MSSPARPASLPPPRLEELVTQQIGRVMTGIAWVRVVTLPAQGALALAVAVIDSTPWRRSTMAAAAVLSLLLGLHNWSGARRAQPRAHLPTALLLGTVLLQGTLLFGTGGIESPFLPMMLPLATAIGFTASDGRQVVATLALQLATLALSLAATLAGWPEDLVPALLRSGTSGGSSILDGLVAGAVATVLVAVLAMLGRRFRLLVDDMVARAFTAQQALLELYGDQARTLRGLSGEIAHELKNPLASIKGIAALLGRDSEGRAAERVAVLRREIERMHGIVEEFLNFSRPLVPLSEERVEIGELLREVAVLHEAAAAERGLRLELAGSEACRIVCDPRKIMQVLVNLVQNAVEASPRGGTVRLLLEARDDSVAARVLDQGPGIDASVRARLFEPGVTSKKQGSGLGLVIARALARQHGGDLTLSDRAEGGCEARLALPIEGPRSRRSA